MNERNAPLQGVVVVDLTRVLAGPYLTMMLSDMGARVIKIEVPQSGDDARHFGPFVNGESAYFAGINRGKESISLNLKAPDDVALFKKLILKADIVVENFRAGTMEKLGLGWDALQSINQKLIYGAVSGFGHSGPYRDRPAYDLVVQGMGGILSLTGGDDGKPVRVGTSIGDISAGMFGLSGVLAALYDREKTGTGVKIDIGMLDCQVAIMENAIGRYFAENKIPGATGLRHPSITPFAGLRAKHDEYLILAAGNDGMFKQLCTLIDRPDLAAAQQFKSNQLRTDNHQQLYKELEKTLAEKPVLHWLEKLNKGGIPCAPVNNIEQVVNDPQVLHRNMVVSTKSQSGAEFSMPGNPIKFSNYPDHSSRKAAPMLDQDRDAVLRFIDEV